MNIQTIKFFEGIDSNVIKDIENGCSKRTFAEGDIIFEKGESANNLYFLEQGKIDLFIKDKDMILCSLDQPGEVVGWSSIVEKGIYTSTCVCKSKASILSISREKIEKIFNQYPNAAITFYRRLGSIFSKRISKALE